MKIFAQALSLLFNPALFFLVIPFFVVYRQTASGLYAFKWLLFSALFVFLGFLYFVIGRIRGTFSDFDLTKREERKPFYFFAWFLSVTYLLAALFFKGIYFPLSIVAIGIVGGLMLFEFINKYIKASVHVGTACAFVVTMSFLYGSKAFWTTFWIIPLVMWSRVVLRRHTLGEALMGATIGLTISFITFIVGRQMLMSII